MLSTLCKTRRWRLLHSIAFFICCLFSVSQAQVSPPVTATTAQHNKQVIGYITQWDAWKEVSGLVPKGGYNQLNVDYSQYTILNFSFFGVAKDGSLHSGDFRNKNIYQVGQVQDPAPLVNTDIYSSWDMYLLYGELETLYYISDGSYAYSIGYRNSGSGWTNVSTGASGAFPLSVHKQGGAPGIIDLAHSKGVKVLASVGGWSMCKHYPEVAADPAKRANFVASCKTLIGMGFDGIDFDWEYPNDPGMDIEHYSTADYNNFAQLLEDVRAAIGSSKLITACFSAVPSKLAGFNWPRMNNVLNYIDMMTYDYNGGWSNKAGHNAPLYDYPGMEYTGFSLNGTLQGIKNLGMNMSKVTLGAPFYGRGVVCSSAATLNGATVKRAETVQPDGPIQTCADFTNWAAGLWDGTPNYAYIQQTTGSGSGWTEYWDDVAKVPYKVKGNYFLSYDNEKSIAAKAQFIKDNGLAGVIVWQVFGDMTNMTSSTVADGKLISCPNTTSPLVNKINAVFASGSTGNQPPTISISSPANNASFTAPASITLQANASDADGTISKVEFFNGSTSLGRATASPYQITWNNVAAGTYTVTAVATDNSGATTTSAAVSLTVNSSGGGGNTGGTGKVIVGYWHNWGSTTASPPYIRLKDVNPKYNVIQVAFGTSGSDYATISFAPENISSADFISDMQTVQSQGRKVLLSLGGQNGTLVLSDATKKAAFISSMEAILDQYNFDGFDLDLEGGTTLQLDNGDNNFMSPTTAKVVNLIAAVKEIINYRTAKGKTCWLTMAPETYYVQTAFAANYSPLVGAYLPIIYGLRDQLTFIHPQYYNTGSVNGMDNKVYSQSTPDFIVAMSEMLLKGFPVAGTGQTFPALREDQVAFGLPAVAAAAPSGGYLAPASVKQALDYLTKGQSFGGSYQLQKSGGYPGLRGIMTWSINWDKTNGDEFANNYYAYFFGNGGGGNTPPAVSITSPANNANFTAPATVTIQASASDADGSVTKVEFFNGSTSLGSVTAAPYSYTWSNVAAGTYTITAKATDNSGAVTTSAAVTIVVGNGGGNTGSCNGIAAWTATGVYVNGNQVVYNGKIYQAKWWTQNEQPDINTGDGKPWQYISDCNGSGGGGGTNTPPVVSITSPAAGATFTAPATVTIQATASDADGSVAKVEFFNGSTSLGAVTASPYSVTWSNVAAGSYSITAVATDNAGATTTSSAMAITVGGSNNTGNCAGVATYQPYPKVYNKGDKVVYNGILYVSLSDALYNVTPGTADYWWQPLGACSATTRVTVATNDAMAVGGASVVPNPITGSQAQVLKYAQSGDRLSISIQSADGFTVQRSEYVATSTGVSAIPIQTGKLAKGIWIVYITNKKTGAVSTTRLVKL
jgi:chitinase